VTRLQAGGPIFDSRQGQRKDFFLFTNASTTTVGPTQLPIQCVLGDLSVEVKRAECEAVYSVSSSEVNDA